MNYEPRSWYCWSVGVIQLNAEMQPTILKKQFDSKSLGRRASKLSLCPHRGVAEKPTLTRQRSVGTSLYY